MPLVEGEKAVERSRDTSASGAGGQAMRRGALACGVRGWSIPEFCRGLCLAVL